MVLVLYPCKERVWKGCVRPRRRVDRENDLAGEARLARVEKDVLINSAIFF